MSDAKKVCSATKDGGLNKQCMAAMQQCADKKAPGNSLSCGDAFGFCVSNTQWPAKISTDSGSFTAKDANSCVQLLNLVIGEGYALKGIAGKKVEGSGSKKPAGDHHDTTESAQTAPAAPAGGAAPPAPGGAAETPVPSDEAASQCQGVGNGDTGIENACHEMVDLCSASSTWPYKLMTTGGCYTTSDKDNCLMLSKLLAGEGYSIGTPETASGASSGSSASSSTSGSSTSTDTESPFPDGKPNFVKSFHDVNLQLNASGKTIEEKRVLHFNGGKGIPIKFKYSIDKLSTGRYMMDYTILKGDQPVGGDQSITFEVNGGGINLGFSITLYNENNFGSVKSITVVEL